MEEKDKIIEIVVDFANRTNEINKRLVCCFAACVITFMAGFVTIAGFYFFSNYEYSVVSQYQYDTGNSKQTIIEGDYENGEGK